MHSYPTYVGVRDEDRVQLGAQMSHFAQQASDGTWTPVDPALYNLQFEYHQKHFNYDYTHLQQTQQPHQLQSAYHVSSPRPADAVTFGSFVPGWVPSMDAFRDLRYDSPSGHYGGNMSESSSDYALSPGAMRAQIAFPSNYLSSPSEVLYSQQTQSTEASFLATPITTPASSQTHLVAMRELEFQGTPEYQAEAQEDDFRAQFQVNPPEELELSDTVATMTTTSRTPTTFSAQSHDGSDSSVSTPAQDNDSDSDFDPRRKLSRHSITGRQLVIRAHRRNSSKSGPTLDPNSRIHKQHSPRPVTNKDKTNSKQLPALSAAASTNANNKAPKSFPCAFHVFGCPSTFANKNEWKRHVTSQHLQLGVYRCDLGSCNPDTDMRSYTNQPHSLGQTNRGRGHNKRRSLSTIQAFQDDDVEEVKSYNDFNRKDLFTQHCRRMHGPLRHLIDNTTQTNQAINARLRAQGRKSASGTGRVMSTKDDDAAFEEELEHIRMRCWTSRRHAPERSSCGFCGKLFEADAHVVANDIEGKAEERAWEERMEHLGRHYERDGFQPSMENIDRDLLEWGLNEGILIEINGVGPWLVGYEIAKPEPEDEEQRREGLRRRGPRRKVSIPMDNKDVKGTTKVDVTIVMKEEDDDEDAMAEDD